MNKVKQKTILITGGSRGIGLSVAQGLLQRGYRVFATARQADDLQRLQTIGIEAISLDLASSASIAEAVAELMRRTDNQLDALFNNSGYGLPGAVEDLSREALRAQFEVNVFGTIELTNQIIPVMRRQQQGRIIFNSSILGIFSLPYRGAYIGSKCALEGMVDALRMELSSTPICISLIEPGPIASDFRVNAFRAYQKFIRPEQSPHQQQYRNMIKNFIEHRAEAAFLLPPEQVLACVVHALESPHPKARYFVGRAAQGLALAKRLCPTLLLDWFGKYLTHKEIN